LRDNERRRPNTNDQHHVPDNSPESWADAPNEGANAPAASETASEQEAASQEAGEEQEAQTEAEDDDPPPEFWSAERKAQWSKITDPELRAAIKGHVDDANKAISTKMEEAAKARKEAEARAQQFEAERGQLAGWWQANGQRIAQMVQGKWAGVDWNKLSAENPGEWARLRQQYESEVGQLRDMQVRHDAEVKANQERQERSHQQERMAEHQKLAAKYPKEFGGRRRRRPTTRSKVPARAGHRARSAQGHLRGGRCLDGHEGV
jgi:hypothetical protein